MRIVVCGCSFSSKFASHPYTHWSEILADSLGAELISLARPGISNGGIRLQMEEAMKLSPDWILSAATTAHRLEFPRDPNSRTKGKVRLKDFNYEDHEDHLLISESIVSIIDGPFNRTRIKELSQDAREAVKQYAAFLFDDNWQQQKDRWMLNSGLWEMHQAGINFIYNPHLIATDNMLDMPDWFVDRYFVNRYLSFFEMHHRYRLQRHEDPGYHISFEGQKKIAQAYQHLIQNRR